MEYEELCTHQHVTIVWTKAQETDGEPSAEVRNSECVLFVNNEVYTAKAKCADKCQLFLPDTDKSAQKAFQYILSKTITLKQQKEHQHGTDRS